MVQQIISSGGDVSAEVILGAAKFKSMTVIKDKNIIKEVKQ